MQELKGGKGSVVSFAVHSVLLHMVLSILSGVISGYALPACICYGAEGLTLGVAKQRAARLWYKGRTLAMTLKHLRIGFYGGVPRVGVERWATTNVAGCVRAAYDEMGK